MSGNDSYKDIEFKNYINGDKDPNTPIWRYLTLKKYIDLLCSDSLFLCRVDKFQDKHEGTLNPYTNEIIENSFGDYPNKEEMQQEWKDSIKSLRLLSFISCWHIADDENPAMWEQYCPNGRGVLIKTTISKLQTSLADIKVGHLFMSPVTYAESINDQIVLENGMNLLCYKRPEFRYENEFRLILLYLKNPIYSEIEEDRYNITPPENGFKYPVFIKTLIEEVYLSTGLSLLDRFRLSLLTRIAVGKWAKNSRVRISSST